MCSGQMHSGLNKFDVRESVDTQIQSAGRVTSFPPQKSGLCQERCLSSQAGCNLPAPCLTCMQRYKLLRTASFTRAKENPQIKAQL